ncbi:hypothetical protein DL96DRAFT_598669 [Flagelloscypha sp. PMI_526]|nr:hypothetical protein DL96DRAFT_598669 [Flagelloscypha sp. PMI_526]
MRSSQSKDLKSFFATLVAHTKPRAPSQLGQSTLQPGSKLDTSLNAAGTILQLARDTGEAASQVPYVKAVAGVLSQIIKIRDEIRSNKERCDEIIDLVQLKSTTILQALDSVYLTNGADVFKDLKSDLEAYADFLRAVLRDDLEPFKTQPRWASYVNRGKKASDLQRLERHLDDFKDRFSIKRLVAISVDARNTFTLLSKPLTPLEIIPQALPPSPKFIIGRESVVESIVQVFLSSSEPRASILGPGGMGKSTIATAVLHDSRITFAYPTKYFVSSELAPTTELLKNRIADAFSIPQSERETDLTSWIVDRIRRSAHPVFLYIDNLETVWEVESEQPKVDHFLDVLSGASSKIALLVTMRGTQEPKTSFPWEATVLHGLDASSSVTMYEGLSGKVADAPAHELLSNLSGSPLAIKLFALMVKEGDKPSQLLSSWNDHGAKTLEIGGKHRLSSLEQSIHLSVFSPRIVDADRLVLGLIALMPDGLSTSSPWFDIFQYILPSGASLQTILRSLRRAALLEENGEPSRWQMLPPIRQFCLRLVDSTSPPVISLVELYMKAVSEYWDHSSFTSRAVILPETANIRSLFVYGSRLQPLPPSFGTAILDYIRWTNWQNIDESGILSSFHDLPIPANDLASLHYCLGVLHRRWHRLSAAEVSFTRAQELYRELQDQFGEASTQTAIGDLHMQRDQLDAADASYTLALDLYEEIENPMGRGNLHQSIGDLHMRRDRLDEAAASFTLALELFTDIQYPHGEASSHKSIGCLLMRRGHFGPAEESFTRARVILDNIEDPSGRADIEESIGNLHMRQNRLDAAEASYHQALKFYSDGQDQLGQANILKTIGDIHMNRDQLDAAKGYFTRASELYRSVQDRLGEAMAHKFIGSVHMQSDQLEAAEASFALALALYGDTQDQHGQALTYEFIGNLHMRRDQLDTAETAYSHALELYIKGTGPTRRGERSQIHWRTSLPPRQIE